MIRLLIAAGIIVGALIACTHLPSSSPFPALDSLSDTEKAQILRSRTTGLQTLVALLAVSVSWEGGERTLDLAVNYDASGKMRFTAFKDLVLGTRAVFDLLLTAEQYRLTIYEDKGRQTRRGARGQLAEDYPKFRAFLIVAEAFFLPGYDRLGAPPQLDPAAPARFTTQLTSGAKVQWYTKSDTLEILKARIEWGKGADVASLMLFYDDYRKIGRYYIPGHVTLSDRQVGLTLQAVVKHVELNVPLAPATFEESHRPGGQGPPTRFARH